MHPFVCEFTMKVVIHAHTPDDAKDRLAPSITSCMKQAQEAGAQGLGPAKLSVAPFSL